MIAARKTTDNNQAIQYLLPNARCFFVSRLKTFIIVPYTMLGRLSLEKRRGRLVRKAARDASIQQIEGWRNPVSAAVH